MHRGFPGGSPVKNPPANAGDAGSIPESGRFLGGGNGSPLRYSYLGNPTDRRAWQATVREVAKESDTTQWLNSNSNNTWRDLSEGIGSHICGGQQVRGL